MKTFVYTDENTPTLDKWRCLGAVGLCSPALALFSSLRLMRRNRGLSGQKGNKQHCSRAGIKVKPRRNGHMVALPMSASIPKIYNTINST